MLSTYTEVDNAIEAEFKALWGTTTYVHWPNTKFQPPAKTQGTPEPAAWVRPTILGGRAFPASAGAALNGHVRHPGTVTVQVFQQEDRGDGRAKALAQTIATHFQFNQALQGVHFKAATVRTIGPKDGWHQVNVTVPFEWDSFS